MSLLSSDDNSQHVHSIRSICVIPRIVPDVLVDDRGAEKVRVRKKVDIRRVILSRDIIIMEID